MGFVFRAWEKAYTAWQHELKVIKISFDPTSPPSSILSYKNKAVSKEKSTHSKAV